MNRRVKGLSVLNHVIQVLLPRAYHVRSGALRIVKIEPRTAMRQPNIDRLPAYLSASESLVYPQIATDTNGLDRVEP